MDEFEIDDSLDTSFSDDSSIDSYESSGDALEAMETAEVPTIEDASFDSVESENIEDYSYEDTEPFNDEVNDVMNSVEVEELTFDDEPIVDVQSVETLEVETERPLEEQSAPDLVEAMNDVEPEALEFDEQVEEVYEAKPNSEQQIILEDGSIDTIENIQANLEAEVEQIEQPVEPYEAKPNSEQQIILEDGSVDTIENIQANLEAETEQIEQLVESYEAKPNSEQQIILEDGSVDTIENIQANLEAEAEQIEQPVEPYEAKPNSEQQIILEDGSIDTIENIQANLEAETEQVAEQYETMSESETEMLQEDAAIEAVENIQEQLDPHEALSNMSEYMNAHNYGMEDYETYSKDPEWQALNRDLQMANGIEPTEIPENISIDNEMQEISEEVKDTDEINEVGSWLKEINPNFDPFDWESPYNNNCGSCTYAVYRRLEGDTEIVATADNIGYNSEMEALTGMEQVSMSPEEIASRLLEQGEGAHAIIGVDRAEGPGHWFNAACIDGKVVAIDGQSGEILDWPPDYGDVVNWEMSVKKEVAEVSNQPSLFSKIQNFFKRK